MKHRPPFVLPALYEKLKQFNESLKTIVNGKLRRGSSNLSETRLAREEPARRVTSCPVYNFKYNPKKSCYISWLSKGRIISIKLRLRNKGYQWTVLSKLNCKHYP